MKFYFMFIMALLYSQFGYSNNSFCHLENSYLNADWNIHNASEFKDLSKQIIQELNEGLHSGQYIFDLSGEIITTNTVDQKEIPLVAIMWDNLKTDTFIMFGDIAILYAELNQQKIPVEIRWFDGQQRNIVYNPEILTCFSEEPPHAINSVL